MVGGGRVASADSTLECPSYGDLVSAIGNPSANETLTLSCGYEDDIVFTGPISVSSNLTLTDTADPSPSIVFYGASNQQLFSVASGGSLTLDGVALAFGFATTGGAVAVNAGGTLDAENVLFSSNTGSLGAAIDNQGTLTVADSYFYGNSASLKGGSVHNGSSGTATITNTTFDTNAASQGAAVNNQGVMHLDGDTFTNNTAGQSGGAISSGNPGGTLPSLTVTGTTVSGNKTGTSNLALGGGLYLANGTANITDSTFSGNSAAAGGALYLDNDGSHGAQVTVTRSTLSGNSAVPNANTASEGGAAYVGALSSLTVTQSTLSGNAVTATTGTSDGGAIASYSVLTVVDSTLAGNSAQAGTGAGIAAHSVSPSVTGTIVADNDGGNCLLDSTSMSGGGYNLENDQAGVCGFSAGNNDVVGGEPVLGALADNGGPTQTMALLSGSPALDAVPAGSAGCPALGVVGTDQRGAGYARPDAEDAGGSCDIGAYEYQGSGSSQLPQAITFTGPTQTAYTYGDGSFTVSANGGGSGNPVTFSVATASLGVCSSDGTNGATVSILAAGTCTVLANQQGNGSYTAAPQASEDFTVAKKNLTVSVSHADISYGDAAPTTFDVGFSGWVGSDSSVPGAVTGGPSCGVPSYSPGSAPGAYDITCTVGTLASSNYSFVDGSNNALPSNLSTPVKLGTLTVDKAVTALVLSNLLQSYNGTPRPVTVTTNPSGLTGVAVSYTGANGTTYGPTSTAPTGTGSYTVNAGLNNTDYSATPVQGTEYVDTNLSGYPKLLSGAYNLSGTNLSGAYLGGANLAGASLSPGNFKGVVFVHATLTGANLSGANFSGADFGYADLTGANLSGANFSSANFAHATLNGANLSGSNLRGATGLGTASLSGVVWNKTVCPDGTNSNNDGGTCVGHG